MRHWVASTLLCIASWGAGPRVAEAVPVDDKSVVSGLVDRVKQLRRAPPFDRPLTMASSANDATPRAWLEALVERPFADFQVALADPWRWCAALVLHINNEGCRVDARSATGPRILLRVAHGTDRTGGSGEDFDFAYQRVTQGDVPLVVWLSAARGPLDSRDHEMLFAAAPVDAERTAVRLSYTFTQGAFGRLALNLYLGTLVKDRVGFSLGQGGDGSAPVGGMRGLLERNLMLYLIALDAAAAVPAAKQAPGFQRRLRAYFAGTERYPRQLRELELDAYLARKEPLLPIVDGGP